MSRDAEGHERGAKRRVEWVAVGLAVAAVSVLLGHQAVRRVSKSSGRVTLPTIPPPLSVEDRREKYRNHVRLRDALAQDASGRPDDLALWLRLARAESGIGDYQGAIRALDHVLSIDPESTVALYAIALYHGHLAQFDHGERYAKRLVTVMPNRIDGWIAASWLSYRRGHRTAATRSLKRAASLSGLSQEDRIRLASQCVALGDPVQAIGQLRLVIEGQPDHAPALALLGAMYLGVSRSKDAIDCLRKAIQLNPGDGRAKHMLARALLDSERSSSDDEIRGLLEQAIKIEPRDVDARITMASYLQKKQRWTEAANQYVLALRVDPERPTARYALSRVCMRLGLRELALRNRAIYHDLHGRIVEETRLRSDLDHQPRKLAPILTLSRFHGRHGEYAKALELAQQANGIDPSDVRARSELDRLMMETHPTSESPGSEASTIR
jgi:tetratricopeptide (TPR) repeat protein